MARRWWWIGPVLVVIIVAGLVWLVGSLLKETKPTQGTLYTVQRGTISAVVRTTGKLEAVRQIRLAFRAGDVVKRTLVKPGDFVPVGTLLMELDTGQLERQLAQAQAQYDISRFNASAQAEKAATSSGNTSTPSPSELYSLARQAQAADDGLANAKNALDNARLYAPFDGTVVSVDINEGDPVNPGQGVITFADLTRLQVRADIDEIDVANVAVGQSVQFSLDAFPGRPLPGQVTLISPAPTQRQGSTIYPAIVTFQRPADLYLRPGMAANLTITSLSRAGVLVVPNRALETIGLRKYVTRLRSDGSLEKIPVETGLTNPDQSEIVTGLNPGDRLSIP